jgi:branched-chain amino acid aminotransferase
LSGVGRVDTDLMIDYEQMSQCLGNFLWLKVREPIPLPLVHREINSPTFRFSMTPYAYFNGQFTPQEKTRIQVTDLAFLRGYGLFDFLRVVAGHPIFIEDHLDRFEQAAEAMGLLMPESRESLRHIIAELIRLNPHPLLGIKLILTGGYSSDGFTPAEKPNFLALANPFDFPKSGSSLRLMSCAYRREIPAVKTLNYIFPIRMLPELKRQSADDFLYYWDDLVSESSRSNVFIVKDQTVITPHTGILPGITRKHILALCQGVFRVEERAVTLREVLGADEVFITSSNQRILPIHQLDDHLFKPLQKGFVTQKLQDLLIEKERSEQFQK